MYDYDFDYDRKYNMDADMDRGHNSYRCGGPASYNGSCGATDCSTCYPGGYGDPEEEKETYSAHTVKTVIARVPRQHGWVSFGEIRKGDTVRVTSGFRYEAGGPRRYFRTYVRMAKGPAW